MMPKQMASTNCTSQICLLKWYRDVGLKTADQIAGLQ